MREREDVEKDQNPRKRDWKSIIQERERDLYQIRKELRIDKDDFKT